MPEGIPCIKGDIPKAGRRCQRESPALKGYVLDCCKCALTPKQWILPIGVTCYMHVYENKTIGQMDLGICAYVCDCGQGPVLKFVPSHSGIVETPM